MIVVKFVKRRRIVLFEFGNTKMMIIGPDAWNDPTKTEPSIWSRPIKKF